MSSQRGNTVRSRPQKYKNQTTFKNDLHDKSQKTKRINCMEVTDVCDRCRKIIEWKIKYKKYKPLKAPGKCTKCQERTVMRAYLTICLTCAKGAQVCPKCGEKADILQTKLDQSELKLEEEIKELLKSLPERKKRTFIRYMNKKTEVKHEDSEDVKSEGHHVLEDKNNEVTREEILTKLKTLILANEKDDDSGRYDLDDFLTWAGVQTANSGGIPGTRSVQTQKSCVQHSNTHENSFYLHTTPGYTIARRRDIDVKDLGPGPGAHYPELCPPMNHSVRPPAYSIKSKGETKIGDDAPGPNAYVLPTCIGPKIPDKPAQGAFSIAGYRELRQTDVGPGPAAYPNLNQDLIKRRSPAYSLKRRRDISGEYVGPGPRYYPTYVTGKQSPKFSFGVKHSECAGTPITELDED
ncbi:hypothetical protein KM043_016636 [Ampulex compressa]|nr:hypothetical protein KM043_016636 [Ampulex compressa]